MTETIVLDPAAVAANRTQLDITNFIRAAGPDWGDAEIEAYLATLAVGSSPVDYRIPNRQITIPLTLRPIGAITFGTIRSQLQQKAALLQREGGWIMRQIDSVPLYADVVSATLHLGGSMLQAFQGYDIDAVLTLQALPDWYGAEVTLDTLTGTGKIVSKLKASTADAVIAGNQPGRVRIIVSDTSANSQKSLLWGLRCRNYGTATTEALAYEAEAMTPLNGAAAAALTGASGGSAVTHASLPAGDWVSVLSSTLLAGTAALTHRGSYRVWARAYIPPGGASSAALRLQWGVGSLTTPTQNDPVDVPVAGGFYLLDLGSIRLDPPPVGSPTWTGAIQASVDVAATSVSVDQVLFQPLDEAAGKLTSYTYYAPPPTVIEAGGATSSSIVDDSSAGAVIWGNPSYAKAYDLVPATASLSTGQITHYLKATGWGFAIPADATINGIIVEAFARSRYATPIYVNRLSLMKGGTILSVNRAAGMLGNDWGYIGSGNWSDLWGTTWTPAEVNASNFGFVLAVQASATTRTSYEAQVDFMRLWVIYTLAASPNPPVDAVCYANGTVEVRTDGAYRAGSATTAYAPITRMVGDLPRLPPSGLENRPVELFVKPSRSDLELVADSGLDSLSATVKYRPSFLYVGGTAL